jgi:D-amino-acid dehydrogenase
MAQRAIVIGGGAIGLAAAHELDASGWRVTVVERGDLGGGCSHANACLIVPSHSQPIPGPGVPAQVLRWMLRGDSPFYVRPGHLPRLLGWGWRFLRACDRGSAARGHEALLALSRASLGLFEELIQAPELTFFYERRGLLNVCLSPRGLEELRDEQRRLQRAGFRVRLLEGDDVRRFEPALAGAVRGGLFVEGEAHGSCLDYLQALAARLRKRGTTVLTGRRVARLVRRGARVVGALLAEPEEEIAADLVVLAAGSWTAELAAPLGLRIPLQPAKGYSCTIDRYPGSPALPLLVHESYVAVTPLGPRLRFAGTLELAGHDTRLSVRRYRAVIDGARSVLATPPPMENERAWCGLRPVTPDGLPIIDRAPGLEGLIVAAGHAMLGFSQSPGTGRLVAELAGGAPPSVPLEPFRANRF